MMNSLMDALREVSARLTRSRARTAACVVALIAPALVAVVLIAAIAPALDAGERIPVALVNLDEGATDNSGKTVNAGNDLVESLQESGELAWDVVDQDHARDGLAEGSYALVFEIPEDYSSKIVSLDSGNPERAQVNIISDGSQNVLATKAGSEVLRRVQMRLRSDVGEDYLVGVLNDVNGSASSLTLAADGSVMLDSGYEALEQGTSGVADGLDQMASGTSALVDGTAQIADGVVAAGTGAQALADGMNTTTTELVEPLAAGAESLAAGVTAASEGITALGTAATQTGQGLQRVSDSLSETIAGLSDVAGTAAAFSQQQASLAQALEGTNTALDAVTTSTESLVGAANTAVSSVDEAHAAAKALATSLAGDPATPETPGLVLRTHDLDTRTADVVAELRTLLSGGAASSGADALALLDELDALTQERTQLSEQLDMVQDQAQTVADQMGTADEALSSLGVQSAAVEAAADEFGAAKAGVDDAAATLSDLAAKLVGPTTSVLGSAIEAKALVDGGASALVPLGTQVTQVGEMFAEDGLLGQAATGVATGTAALPQVLSSFSSAASGIASGNHALGEALQAVGSGVSALSSGMGTLADVQSQLAVGVTQLHDGQKSIMDTVSQAGEDLSELSSSYSARADVASSPVTFVSTVNNRVDGSASQIMPTVVAVLLWMGVVVASALVPAYDGRAALAERPLWAVLPSFVVSAGIAVAQAVVIVALVALAGGVELANLPAFAALMVLGALACAAVAQAAWLLFERASGVVLILATLVQLVCAGSILPAAMTGGIFDALGAVLPVPVLTDALRGAVSGSLIGFGGAEALLATWAVFALAVSLVAVRRFRHVRPEYAFARS